MKPLAAALVLAALVVAGCKSSSQDGQPAQAAPQAEVTSTGIRSTSQPAPESGGGGGGSPSALSYIATPFENVIYLPWKLVVGAVKGFGDGIGAGFDKGRMPATGALFAPVNAVVGFVTGAFEGVALSPFLVGPSDSFSYAMSQPTKHATTIWWYE